MAFAAVGFAGREKSCRVLTPARPAKLKSCGVSAQPAPRNESPVVSPGRPDGLVGAVYIKQFVRKCVIPDRRPRNKSPSGPAGQPAAKKRSVRAGRPAGREKRIRPGWPAGRPRKRNPSGPPGRLREIRKIRPGRPAGPGNKKNPSEPAGRPQKPRVGWNKNNVRK